MSRGSFGRYLAFAIALLLVANKTKHRTKQQHTTETAKSNKDRKPEIVSSKILSLPSIEVRSHSEERKYQEERNKYNWVQPALLVFTGLAAIFSAWAASESSRQATAAEEQNRPWLQPLTLKVEALGYQAAYENIYIRAVLTYRNDGHSPAVRVFPYSEMLLDPYETFVFHDYVPEKVCRRADYPSWLKYNNVIFPGKEYSSTFIATRPFTDVRKAYDGAFWSKDKTFDEARSGLHLRVYGCLIYKDGSDSIRKTAFVFDLGNVDVSNKQPIQSRAVGPVSPDATYAE